MKRYVTAAALLLILWFVLRYAPPGVFFAVGALTISAAVWECFRLFEAIGWKPFKLVGMVASLALNWSFMGFEPSFGVEVPIAAVALIAIAAAMAHRPDPGAMLRASVGTVFPVAFVGLTLSYALAMRSFPGEDGKDVLILLFGCVILADSAAFLVGTSIGRHKLAPRLSPNKSWEGAIGGIAASVVGACIAHFWFYQRLPLGHAVLIGVLVAGAAILGDLSESMMKRAANVKDSSSLLPGHGGMLDRVDSLLFAGPVLYYYYRLFL